MYVTIDMGGTNTRVAASANLKDIAKVEKFPTHGRVFEQKDLIKNAITVVCEGKKPKAICLGVPGILDKDEERFLKFPNYPALNNLPYSVLLDGKFKDIPLVVENDACLSGLGEAVYGAGKDYLSIGYLTLSTGVGGVRVQKIDKEIHYFSAEPGHMIIIEDGKFNQGCGQYGCFESYSSGKNFMELFGMHPADCMDSHIWEEYAKHLSVGIVNVIAMWNPDAIILGGSMSKKFNLFYPALLSNLERQNFFSLPEIATSEFGDNSGLVGGFVHMRMFV